MILVERGKCEQRMKRLLERNPVNRKFLKCDFLVTAAHLEGIPRYNYAQVVVLILIDNATK